ncbi:unnamed protein product [Durusdinium trenchii]|uniref:Uncharacterized protein n=1 Tax=Durusdinium trenchii TaxID=1381693 RepID=A0ABP0MJ89_9DINO
MEDDEEAAAWAALRAAFGEDPEEARTVKKPRVEPTTENSPRKAPPKRSDSTDDWLQGEVDRLVGEIQRLAKQPLPTELLNAVWKLPLEQQHDVLLGTRELLHGNCVNSTGRVWHFLATEVRDRGVELPSFSSIPRGHRADPFVGMSALWISRGEERWLQDIGRLAKYQDQKEDIQRTLYADVSLTFDTSCPTKTTFFSETAWTVQVGLLQVGSWADWMIRGPVILGRPASTCIDPGQ